MKNKYLQLFGCFFSIAFFLIFSLAVQGLSFPVPKANNDLIGAPQIAEVTAGEDFSDVALRFGIGYYELFEANPGVNPDEPPTASELIVPTQYILPAELKANMILINVAEMRLYYRPKEGNLVYIFPVGIGKVDWDTPTGEMHVVEKIEHPVWVVPDAILKLRAAQGDILPKVVPAGPENPLGSYALRLSGGSYLIHGTNLPAGVGRRSSAGCIRLYETDIKKLFSMVTIGTPVLIINQPYKAGWLDNKLYLEAHLPLLEQRLEAVSGDMSQVIRVIDAASSAHRANINWKKAFKIAKEHLCVPRPIED